MDASLALAFPEPASSQGRWTARLDLTLGQRAGKSRVTDSRHFGPLRIQRPFHPEADGTAHVYLLHPPGGVAGGDSLDVDVTLEAGGSALLTTPAATKLYRSSGERARVAQELTVRAGCLLEWLPQETIAFSGALADLSTVVHLEEGAQFLGWEILCLGRPASQDDFERGQLRARLEVWREETPLFADRITLGSGSATRDAIWGLGGHRVTGTMVIAGSSEGLSSVLRAAMECDRSSAHLGCTDLLGATVLRYVGPSVVSCFEAFVLAWQTVRPVLAGKAAVLPRIWSC